MRYVVTRILGIWSSRVGTCVCLDRIRLIAHSNPHNGDFVYVVFILQVKHAVLTWYS